MDSKDLWVELKPDRPSYMVLRGTYGEKVHQAFKMTRQGVRWRFWRLFNDIYVSAFETILFIEKTFSTELREHAIRISREAIRAPSGDRAGRIPVGRHAYVQAPHGTEAGQPRSIPSRGVL